MFDAKKIKTVAAALLIVLTSGLIAVSSAWAGEPEQKAKEPNAAEGYVLAFEALQDNPAKFREEFLLERFPELPEPLRPYTAEELAIINSGDVKQMTKAHMKAFTEVMRAMRAATSIENCDWKLETTQAAEKQPYFVEPAKTLGKLGCLRADYFMVLSNRFKSPFNKNSMANGAVKGLAAVMTMARRLKVDGSDSLFLAEFEVEEMAIRKTAALYLKMQANTREFLKKELLTLPEAKAPSIMTAEQPLKPDEQKIFDGYILITELRSLLQEGLAREVELDEDGTPKAFTLTSEKTYEGKPIELVFESPISEEEVK